MLVQCFHDTKDILPYTPRETLLYYYYYLLFIFTGAILLQFSQQELGRRDSLPEMEKLLLFLF